MFLNYIYIFILSIVTMSLVLLSSYVSTPINIYHSILLIISIGLISYSISERILFYLIKELTISKNYST